MFIIFICLGVLFYKNSKETSVKGVSNEKKIYTALAIPNDSLYSSQWNFKNVSAEAGWNYTTGNADVVIAVLDTGILTSHVDLQNKVVAGYDFIGGDNDPNPDAGGGSAAYHGTIVAGVAAATTNNATGVAGGCWNCKIMPVRVLDNNGEGTSDIIADGIRFAADNGAKVINMSFGYDHSYGPDSYLTNAIDYAHARGVVMVAAAGNDGGGVNYPAAYEKVIAVGATDSNNVRPTWSSYGPELDVVAPGVSVLSTYTYWNNSTYVTNAYANSSGTSIAAPHVASLAALLKSRQSSLSNEDVRISITTNTEASGGFNNYLGFGKLSFKSLSNISESSCLSEQPCIKYRAHVENIGWQDWISEGIVGGTVGRSLRVEAIQLDIENKPLGSEIECRAHVENIGWQEWVGTTGLCGTVGRGLRVEAIQLKLKNLDSYKIIYRGHVQRVGWEDWKIADNQIGTTGRSLRMEAIKLNKISQTSNPLIQYRAQIRGLGWGEWAVNPDSVGTTGKSLALEAVEIKGSDFLGNISISCRAHVQNLGWLNWVGEGERCGTSGKGLKIEALELKINNRPDITLKYSSHIQNVGWQSEVVSGQFSGTTGRDLSLEAFYVKFIKN